MAIDFIDNVKNNVNNLNRWRSRYSKEEYPYKVILNLFYDLIPLQNMWNEFDNSFGHQKFNDLDRAFSYVHEKFRNYQLSLQPVLVDMLKIGVDVGGLKSENYNTLIEKAKSKSNQAIEEIEYTYIVRNAIKASFLYWYSFGLTGHSKQKSYENIFSIILPISDFNSFEEVFKSFAQSASNEISGLKRPDGTILKAPIYFVRAQLELLTK